MRPIREVNSRDNDLHLLGRLANATPEQLRAINGVLAGDTQEAPPTGPLLLNQMQAAKRLGVSRSTVDRMVKAGRLPRIELLPGTFRIRSMDIHALVTGKAVTQ